MNLISKESLRVRMKELRDSLNVDERANASMSVCNELRSIQQNLGARVVHSFIPFGSEIDIWPVIQEWRNAGVTVVCPKTLKGRELEHLELANDCKLEIGRFGTKHPSGTKQFEGDIDLILVPGLAFDLSGGRLGYGAGYYDTFLADHVESYKVGVCFKNQMVHSVPMESHDVVLDKIISG